MELNPTNLVLQETLEINAFKSELIPPKLQLSTPALTHYFTARMRHISPRADPQALGLTISVLMLC